MRHKVCVIGYYAMSTRGDKGVVFSVSGPSPTLMTGWGNVVPSIMRTQETI